MPARGVPVFGVARWHPTRRTPRGTAAPRGPRPASGSTSPSRTFPLRARPYEIELASQEPREAFRFLFRRAYHPPRLLFERLDPDGQPLPLALVAPDAFNAAVDQQDRRQPALRAVDPTLEGSGHHGLTVPGRRDDVMVEGGQETHHTRQYSGLRFPNVLREHPGDRPFDLDGCDLSAKALNYPPRLRWRGRAEPPGELLARGGSVGGQVTARDLPDGLPDLGRFPLGQPPIWPGEAHVSADVRGEQQLAPEGGGFEERAEAVAQLAAEFLGPHTSPHLLGKLLPGEHLAVERLGDGDEYRLRLLTRQAEVSLPARGVVAGLEDAP